MHIAVIPARGGSKRLPRKNVRPVGGRPSIAYPIGAALECGCFDRVVVSTEDAEIAEGARGLGADVALRPSDLASDTATLPQVWAQFLDAEAAAGRAPETFCSIFATAVLLRAADLRLAHERLTAAGDAADGVIATAQFNLSPLQAFRRGPPDAVMEPMFPEFMAESSQTHPALIGDAGAFYWLRTASFRRNPRLFTNRLIGVELPKHRAVDMDTPEDLLIAERFLAME